MKMMSCIFDDEEVSGESSSTGSSCSVTVGQEQQSNSKEKLNLKYRFIKKKPSGTSLNKNSPAGNSSGPKVQRSASAILRSKMYAVVAKKRKISKPMEQHNAEENNIGEYSRMCIFSLFEISQYFAILL